jgi:predicted nuclease of predicted toxin-antitoxin system
MTKALFDQGLPRTAAGLLRKIGWDVQHVSERGMS